MVHLKQYQRERRKILLSIIVGLYHFIMPLIGLSIGLFVTNKIIINTNILVGIILSLIAIETDYIKFQRKKKKNFF